MIADLTTAEKKLICVYLALAPKFQRVVLEKTEEILIKKESAKRSRMFSDKYLLTATPEEGWHPVSELSFRIFWGSAVSTLRENNAFGALDEVPLRIKVAQHPLMQTGGSENPTINAGLNDLFDILGKYDRRNLDNNVGVVLGMFDRFMDMRLALAAVERQNYGDIRENSAALAAMLGQVQSSTIQESPIMDPDVPLPSGIPNRIPMGIKWLDIKMGGGMFDGDAALFVAPSGGGKTIFATQVVWERAKNRREHAVYLSYEQSVRVDLATDISLRFYSMATDMDRTKFEKKDLRNLDLQDEHGNDVREKLQKAREAFGRYCHTFDLSSGSAGIGGLSDIRKLIENLTYKQALGENNEPKSCRPSLIVVDWVETAVKRYMAAKGMPLTELTSQMDLFAAEFAKLCRDEHINGLMLQQLDTESQTSKGEPHHTKAARCKSMGNYCRWAFGVPKLADNVGKFYCTKATTSQLWEEEVFMNAKKNRFELAIEAGRTIDPASGEVIAAQPRRGDAPTIPRS